MNLKQAQQQRDFYMKNQVLTASPNKLISLLLEAAIKAVKLAQMALANQQMEKANHQLVHAQDIIDELKFSLDHSVDEQLTASLAALYDFMAQQLVTANVSKDQSLLPQVQDLLEQLLTTWNEVSQK